MASRAANRRATAGPSHGSTASTSPGPGPTRAEPGPDGASRETEWPALRRAATAPRRRSTSPSAPARTRRTRRVLGDLHAAGGDVSEEVGGAHHHDVGTGARHLAQGELVCLLEAVVD